MSEEASVNLFKKWIKEAKSIKQRFEFLAENPIMSDFKFIVGPEKIEVPAHKYIFAVTSFDFFNLFFLSASTDNEIHLEEINYESFQEFIQYVYTDDIKIVSENVFDILTLSLRYDMEHLTGLCVKEFPNVIEDDSTGRLMDLYEIWNKKSISKLFLNTIGRRPLDYIHQENVEKLTFEDLSVILKSKETETFEVDYFKLAMMWAKKQCILMKIKPCPSKNRLVLEKLFFQIRFPTMTLDEFQKCSAAQNGLFTNEEMFQLIQFINSKSEGADKIEFCLSKRVMRESKKVVGSQENRNKSKFMLVNLTPEVRTYVAKSNRYECEQITYTNFFVKKSILLHGINLLLSEAIMNFWKVNVQHLTIELCVSGGALESYYKSMLKMDIPTQFPDRFQEKTFFFEKALKLKASAKAYNVAVIVTCSVKENPFKDYRCVFSHIFIYETPLTELVSANPNICEFVSTKRKETAISNLLFSLEKIKLLIKMEDGRTISIEVDPFDTTEIVKEAINKAERISTYGMSLFFNGTFLEDSETIDKYKIINDSVLDLARNLVM